MDGWRGLVVLTIGLAIGAALWFGVASLVEPPGASGEAMAKTRSATAKGLTAAAPAEAQSTPQSFLIAKGADELQSQLEAAPFVHRGLNGPSLYVITFRSCPSCAAFKDEEWGSLERAGVDIRWIVYARRDVDGHARSLAPERALVAELVLNRSYPLLDAWLSASSPEAYYQTAQLPAAAESSPERLAALEQSRALVDSLSAITSANGQELEIPSFFWRDTDGWHGMIGYDQAAFAQVKAALLQSAASASASAPASGAKVITPPHATSAPEAATGTPN